MPSLQQPYPMNIPIKKTLPQESLTHQIVIYYNGKPHIQNNYKNKSKKIYDQSINNAIVYPTTHSIPGPFLQSYIALPNKMYPY